ncbi:hypothetical protein [Chelatococcus sp.]|uniref:hypothetical protein n=1 Tax=Chelatococcus sp. TaxID=1953771 RepID=UPI001EB939C8|nr:hypothetical protein [Chelatococcus sp.]MBX3547319.1 hypothetical protein [Chelatococcus sp.]CAH1677967.1 hypothetical protein CHELA41_24469 [Hyphomicrobiales bacterium]
MNVASRLIARPEDIQAPKDVEAWLSNQVEIVAFENARSVVVEVGEKFRKGDDLPSHVAKLSQEMADTIYNFLVIHSATEVGLLFDRPECTAWNIPEDDKHLMVVMRYRLSSPSLPEKVKLAA